jgi:hypothetical protein
MIPVYVYLTVIIVAVAVGSTAGSQQRTPTSGVLGITALCWTLCTCASVVALQLFSGNGVQMDGNLIALGYLLGTVSLFGSTLVAYRRRSAKEAAAKAEKAAAEAATATTGTDAASSAPAVADAQHS